MKAVRTGIAAVAALVAAGCGASNPGSAPLTPIFPVAAALHLTAANLTFVAAGAAHAQTFDATETGYAGAFVESDTCAGLATVTPSSASGPSATFAVTPSANGSCTVTIHDANAQSTAVGVAIAIPPPPANPPVAAPNALSFVAVGGGNAQTATVTEAGYNGTLTQNNTCAGIATVNASGANGPSVTYTITPTASGACSVTVTDALNASDTVNVVVSTSGVIIQ